MKGQALGQAQAQMQTQTQAQPQIEDGKTDAKGEKKAKTEAGQKGESQRAVGRGDDENKDAARESEGETKQNNSKQAIAPAPA